MAVGRSVPPVTSPSRTSPTRKAPSARAGWSGSMVLVSHDVEFVRALSPHKVLMMPDGELAFWDDELLGLVALA